MALVSLNYLKGENIYGRNNRLSDRTFEERVRQDFRSGVRSGVNGTPTFYINGARHDDAYDFEVLVAALEKAAGA